MEIKTKKRNSAHGPPPDIYGFTSREHDDEIGLVFFRSRYYDPAIGRFTQEDKIRKGVGSNFVIRSPDSPHEGTNYFAYVINDPINKSDPNGENALLLGGLIAIVISAFLIFRELNTVTHEQEIVLSQAPIADAFHIVQNYQIVEMQGAEETYERLTNWQVVGMPGFIRITFNYRAASSADVFEFKWHSNTPTQIFYRNTSTGAIGLAELKQSL